MNSLEFSIVLVFIFSSNEVVSKKRYHDVDDQTLADRESAFNCYKHKTCFPGNTKVCGYEPNIPWLAVFADLCTFYKANCLKAGRFQLVPQIVCDTKIQYEKEHVNDTFDFIHVLSSTTSESPETTGTRRPGSPRYKPYDIFAAFHCYKSWSCTSTGKEVCGEDFEISLIAKFEDLCVYHGVNCKKLGRFWLITPHTCKANLTFKKSATAYYNQPATFFTLNPLQLKLKRHLTARNDTRNVTMVAPGSARNYTLVDIFKDFLRYLTYPLWN